MPRSKRKFVWQIGLENLCTSYERAQLEQAQEFLAASAYDPNYVPPEPDPMFALLDEFEDLELLNILLDRILLEA